MKLFFAAVTLVCAFACTKKVEPVLDAGTPVELPKVEARVEARVEAVPTTPDSGTAVVEEAKALKQEVKEVLQSVADAGVEVGPPVPTQK